MKVFESERKIYWVSKCRNPHIGYPRHIIIEHIELLKHWKFTMWIKYGRTVAGKPLFTVLYFVRMCFKVFFDRSYVRYLYMWWGLARTFFLLYPVYVLNTQGFTEIFYTVCILLYIKNKGGIFFCSSVWLKRMDWLLFVYVQCMYSHICIFMWILYKMGIQFNFLWKYFFKRMAFYSFLCGF